MAKTPTALSLLLASLVELGDPVAELAAEELRELAAVRPWQALALGVAAQAVQDHGPDGLKLAMTQLSQLAEGKITELDVVDARTSHAILAAMERDEVRGRREVRDWFAKLGKVLNSLGVVFLAGVVSGALGGAGKPG